MWPVSTEERVVFSCCMCYFILTIVTISAGWKYWGLRVDIVGHTGMLSMLTKTQIVVHKITTWGLDCRSTTRNLILEPGCDCPFGDNPLCQIGMAANSDRCQKRRFRSVRCGACSVVLTAKRGVGCSVGLKRGACRVCMTSGTWQLLTCIRYGGLMQSARCNVDV